MSNSLDTLSYVGGKFGGADYIPMPGLPGTSASDDPGLQKVFLVGAAAHESKNWVKGLSQPAIDLITIPHKSWFNATNLAAALTSRDAQTGQLASLNDIAYRIGNGVGSDEVAGCFSDSFWTGLQLSGGGLSGPVSARIGIVPCGTSQAFPVALGTYPAGIAGYFMNEGVTFGGLLTDVLSWSLTITNSLAPDVALPLAGGVPLASAKVYPPSYVNGPIGVMLTLVQKSNATIVDAASLATLNDISIVLTSAETSAPSQETVTFAFQGLKPMKGSGVSLGLTTVSRTYVGMADASASFIIS